MDSKRTARVKERDNNRRQARQVKRQLRTAAPAPQWTPAAPVLEVSAWASR